MNLVKRNARVKNLQTMDLFLRTNIDDEEIIVDDWLAFGVPDGADEDTLKFIAVNDENYIDCLESFARCVFRQTDQNEED